MAHRLGRESIPLSLGEDIVFYGLDSSISLPYIMVRIRNSQAQNEIIIDEEEDRLTLQMEQNLSEDATTQMESNSREEEGDVFLIPWIERVLPEHNILEIIYKAELH